MLTKPFVETTGPQVAMRCVWEAVVVLLTSNATKTHSSRRRRWQDKRDSLGRKRPDPSPSARRHPSTNLLPELQWRISYLTERPTPASVASHHRSHFSAPNEDSSAPHQSAREGSCGAPTFPLKRPVKGILYTINWI